MLRSFFTLVLIAVLFSCSSDESTVSTIEQKQVDMIKAVDISAFPKIEDAGFSYKNSEGATLSLLDLLKENGVNTVRLKLWVHPADNHSGFDEVKFFSYRLKAKGFKTWLTVHYSDTWADPGRQEIPAAWEAFDLNTLSTTVYNYTTRIVAEIQPDFIQIGNEINSGFMHPQGNLITVKPQFLQLMQSAIQAVRDYDEDIKIILHYAGHEDADWFFNEVRSLDYDIAGLSYYPIWHGKSLSDLGENINQLNREFNKPIIIAETAYPFTLGFNDFTNNIVGLENQLIPEFTATPGGQRDFLQSLKSMSLENESLMGFCYWGAELVAWNGNESTQGSPWENLALFDFDGRALPVLGVFQD